MNKLMQKQYPIFSLYQSLRDQLMQILTDADLNYQLGGQTLPLGVLCREIGETQHQYIESFRTFVLPSFDYCHPQPEIAGSVAALSVWFAQMDAELKDLLSSFSDENLAEKVINRGEGFTLPISIQLEIYKEALLIFYGKVSIYLRAMQKPRPEQWQEWIA